MFTLRQHIRIHKDLSVFKYYTYTRYLYYLMKVIAMVYAIILAFSFLLLVIKAIIV